MMFEGIRSVTPLPNAVLLVTFFSGRQVLYDVRELANEWAVFAPVCDNPALFATVAVSPSGRGVGWDEDTTIMSEEININGVPVDDDLQYSHPELAALVAQAEMMYPGSTKPEAPAEMNWWDSWE